jgi:CHAD domain-containing protein
MDDNRAAIVSGRTDPRHLHDMRVAMNRFRAALRLFRSWLAETSADRLIRELGDFRRKIASARDSQVWTRILRSRPVLRRLRRTPDGKAHLRAQEREGRRQAACLKRALESRTYAGLKSDMARLARIEVRGPAVMGDARLFRAHVARKLMRTYRRLIRERPPGGGGSIAELHALRKRCRRARYWAELGAPVLGSVGPKLVRRLKRVTDALGDLHDIDIRRGRREDDASPMPGSLAALLKKRRAVAAKDFEKAWRALREKTFRRHLMKVLRAARKSD